MAEVLSQKEIDALLDGMRDGELTSDITEHGKVYQSYDFRRPRKFSKDNIRTLQILHETFARQFSTNLAGMLRTTTRCHLESIEQLTFEEFTHSLASPTLLCIAATRSENRPVLAEVGLPLVFGILDRMLGGPGVGDAPNRELTEIEQALFEDVVHQMLAGLSTAWSTIAEVDFRLEKMESRSQFAQVVAGNETVLNVCLETTVGSYEGFVNLCFPYTSLETVLASFSTERWFASNQQTAGEGGTAVVLKDDLLYATVQVTAELGKMHISLSDLKNLAEGQVIHLDNNVNEPVVVRVGKRSAFKARPGIHGKLLAVQVQGAADIDGSRHP